MKDSRIVFMIILYRKGGSAKSVQANYYLRIKILGDINAIVQ